ncbi:MAG: carboxypeptidase-like regulatory domain-containing protein [Planctomycetes bacterium]|nr:carboxypeptidase-like regulatory domain-containing protein [Planctomycetota bacterium]
MLRLILIGLVALFALGCGGAAGFTTVQGTVTYDGKPLTNGYVTILPDGEGESASGQIGSDGRFTLTTFSPNDGVKPGKYKVRIASYLSEAKMNDPSSGKPAIPDKYFDVAKSGLTVTIEGKSQTLDLNLPKE